MKAKFPRIALTLLCCAKAFGVQACEPVSDVPAELSNGVYCLVADVNIGNAIAFRLLGDVTLDCQGHRIKDLTRATGNAVVAEGSNVVVKNCVFDGFGLPLLFTGGAYNYRAERNTFVGSYSYGIIANNGGEGLIRANTFIAPTPLTRPWLAMEINGVADIVDNTVIDSAEPGQYGFSGIMSYDNDGGVIARNLVQTISLGGWQGTAMNAGGRSFAYRNVLVSVPGSLRKGLVCQGGVGSVSENLIVGYGPTDCPIQHQTSLRSQVVRKSTAP
ncbi:MAG: hypothetical protein ACTHOC_05130 [Luteimonas sp.]